MIAAGTDWNERIFSINNAQAFHALALELFRFQAAHVPAYYQYLKLLNISPSAIDAPEKIPFLPVGFFRNHNIIADNALVELVFESSGTGQQTPSRHLVADRRLYERSFTNCFHRFYGNPADYCILALLPSYLERSNSSLVYMTDALIKQSGHPQSGFFLHEYEALHHRLSALEAQGQKTLLLGVSFALLDFAEQFPMRLKHTVIMETGGMKDRRKELTRAELHAHLQQAFGVEQIHSEYGMTELLSQAYSFGAGIFNAPPWMRVLIRNAQNPFEILRHETTGGINIIDLANIYSCAFIQTDDFGRRSADDSFEVLGRMDNAELRGCNLLLE